MTFHCVRPNFAQDYTILQNEKSYWLIQAGCLITIPFTKTFVERYRKIFVMIPFGYIFTGN